MTEKHLAPERDYTLSHALFWTGVLALSAYITIADIRVSKLWQNSTLITEEE